MFRLEMAVKAYLEGNEAARANPNEALYTLAQEVGFTPETDLFDAFVSGGAAYRFNGHTFETRSEDIK